MRYQLIQLPVNEYLSSFVILDNGSEEIVYSSVKEILNAR